jgi:hypothetical protein
MYCTSILAIFFVRNVVYPQSTLKTRDLYLIKGKYYFADLRMTFRQNFFLQDWFRNKLGVGLGLGLELVFGIGLVLVKPLLCYVLSL